VVGECSAAASRAHHERTPMPTIQHDHIAHARARARKRARTLTRTFTPNCVSLLTPTKKKRRHSHVLQLPAAAGHLGPQGERPGQAGRVPAAGRADQDQRHGREIPQRRAQEVRLSLLSLAHTLACWLTRSLLRVLDTLSLSSLHSRHDSCCHNLCAAPQQPAAVTTPRRRQHRTVLVLPLPPLPSRSLVVLRGRSLVVCAVFVFRRYDKTTGESWGVVASPSEQAVAVLCWLVLIF
jgi:hypothetical protein